jgi:hypothetical protein
MSHEEINDDLAHAKPPYKVIACLAVHGRLPLLEHTIRRLYLKNGCYKVICSGDGLEEKRLCESLGAVWVEHRNKPLGAKWNASFKKAKEYDPDAVLYVGSSDWISNNWISDMRPYVEKYGFAGVPGCQLADVALKAKENHEPIYQEIRSVKWKGYKGYRKEREDETIGSGRMLSRRLLDAIGWLPFDPLLDNSLDRSMKDNAAKHGFVDWMIHNDNLKSLSISTNQWENKHKFDMHWPHSPMYRIPSEKIDPGLVLHEFPELKLIFKYGS